MNNIDVLEEFINNYKKVQEKYKDDEIQAEIERSCYFEEVPYQAISTLIAENKELKERNKRQQENLKITNKKIAAQRGQLMMLNKAYIPKSKVKEVIEELEAMSISQEIYYEDILKILQSLLGKE